MIQRIAVLFLMVFLLAAIAEEVKSSAPKPLTTEQQLQVVQLSLEKANAAGQQVSAVRAMENAQRTYEDAQKNYNFSTAKLNEVQEKIKKITGDMVVKYKAEGFELDEGGKWVETKKQ